MQQKRFDELEGLRGLAAVVVVAYHFLLAFYLFSFLGPGSAPQNSWFEDNLYGNPIMGLLSGTFAVAVFFVISGFVLSIGFFQSKKIEVIKKLAAKRYLRLMLPALASTLLCFLVIILGISKLHEVADITHSSWLANTWLFSPTLFDAIKSATFDIFMTEGSPYNNVLWTMATEFAGSFLIFGFLALFGKSKSRAVLYGFLGFVTFNTWFFPFVAGMILADMHVNGRIAMKRRSWKFILPSLAVVVFLAGCPIGPLGGTIYEYITFTQTGIKWYVVLLSVAAIILVYLILSTTQLNGIFKSKMMTALGKYTFSLYLVHLIVLYTFGMAMFYILSSRLGIGYNTAVFTTLIASIPVVAGATVLFEKYIDAPSIKVSSMFAKVVFSDSFIPRFLERAIIFRDKAIHRLAIKRKAIQVEETEVLLEQA